MSSIRKTKKAMKRSNGFFTVVVDNGMCFCVSEWYTFEWQITIVGENSLKEFNKYRRKR